MSTLGQDQCGLFPRLIPCCLGSKSTLSCPQVHYHCLKHGCFPPLGASTLPGQGAACINWPFLQVRDKDNKGKLIIIQSMLKPQERTAIDNCVCIVTVIPFNMI